MTARVVRLTRYRFKGDPGEPVDEMVFLKGLGIEGDFHQGGERQVSLLSAEARRWMDAQPVKGLCFRRFRENVLIEGALGGSALCSMGELPQDGLVDCPPLSAGESPLDGLTAGTLLSIGGVVLRIGMAGKRCFPECELYSQKISCRLADCACFAAVEQGGIVRAGDRVAAG